MHASGQGRAGTGHGAAGFPAGVARSVIGALRPPLPGARAWKTALASALSWAVGAAIPGAGHPYFAPLAAVLTVQVTVAATVARAAERVGGVVVGVLVALVFAQFVGLSWWSIGLVVLAALAAGSWLRLGVTGPSQAAISALLVLILGSLTRTEYAWARIVETVVGALAGVVVNVLLVPPDQLPQARAGIRKLAWDTGSVLRRLGDLCVPQGPADRSERSQQALDAARSLAERVSAAARAVEAAEESLRWNLLAAPRRRALPPLRRAQGTLERAVMQVRGMARTLYEVPGLAVSARWTTRRDEADRSLAGMLAALASAVEAFGVHVDAAADPGAEAPGNTAIDLRAACAEAERRSQNLAEVGPHRLAWRALGAVLTDASRMVEELRRWAESEPGNALVGRPVGGGAHRTGPSAGPTAPTGADRGVRGRRATPH